MVQKVAPTVPRSFISSIIPQNKVVRVALLIIGCLLVLRIFRSLRGRGGPPPKISGGSDGPTTALIEGCRLRKTDVKRAYQILSTAAEGEIKNIDTRTRIFIQLADIDFQGGNFDQAILHLNRASERPLELHYAKHILRVLGQCYAEKNQPDLALKDLEAAMKCLPLEFEGGRILLIMSQVYSSMGQMEEALKKNQEAFAFMKCEINEVLPCTLPWLNARHHYGFALCWNAYEKWDECYNELTQAHDLVPDEGGEKARAFILEQSTRVQAAKARPINVIAL